MRGKSTTSSERRNPPPTFSLRLGHATALTVHRTVIHYRVDTALPSRGRLIGFCIESNFYQAFSVLRSSIKAHSVGVDDHIDPSSDEILSWLPFRGAGKNSQRKFFNPVTSSIQTYQKCKEVRDRSAEDEKVENEVIISFESAD